MSKSITYRDLRNTPGAVFERLAAGEPIPLVSEGSARGLLIPVEDGDVATAIEAWRRGRALVALSRLQVEARRQGTAELTSEDITTEVGSARTARKRRHPGR